MASKSADRDIVQLSDVLSEFIGTFTLIFIGVGSIIATQAGFASGTAPFDLLAVAVAHGFALVCMISAVGHISGGHFNPAVTLGTYVTQKISGRRTIVYWASQLAGGSAAAYALKVLVPKALTNPVHLGAVSLGAIKLQNATTGASSTVHIGATQGMFIEAILTFFLVWVVFATAIDKDGSFGKIAGLGIGTVVMIDILMGGTLTGAAMNPARAFGPALASGHWSDFWVWIAGPAIGAVVAALAYDRVVLKGRDA